ncbi:DNA-binding transcriptional regulator, PucR family [Pedococcus dokdonensis]|uniref:DNA-binding transcriptional regulator, PucR family n=1 Tax=Pedococcus dokdonensis TaxID=443156 RepID=A0A1H0TDY6_9MICO|nr:helix-turn-helix domain-containing protein [Pedococcus dokdonensis]SDP51808.1 DNA-binding transcriptional regulator, PucR family [Pedococcus dokdonensis]
MLAVTDLVATLGGLLTLGVPRQGAEVDDLTIAEPGQGIVGQPGDLVLGVGVESAEAAADLVRRAAEAGAGGVVLRRGIARRRTVRDRARRSGVALVELAEQASWAHLVWLLRGVIDRAAVGPGRHEDAPVQDDLFALADAAAALVDAPVTIEDAQSRVLAYSSRQDLTDPARVSTIVGRRVPDEVLATLRAQGVFRRLARSAEPVFVPASGGTKPRLVIPVRAGGEWLGSIWAVVEERPPAALVGELVQTSSVVALHLLRLRAQADLSRRVAADRLRGVLSGNVAGAADWLPPGPWRVVALGGDGDPARLLDVWESVCRRHAWNQPLLADLDGRGYAVVRDSDEASPGSWAWLREVVAQARRESLALTARAGRTAYAPADLERSRGEAQETDRVVAPGTAVATHEQVWAEVTVARAAGALSADLLGPLAALRDHDAEHHSEHLRTLAAWLDHPGAPTAAARAIHVHPNTMRYRMARIADLAGLDLDDPTVRLATRLQLAALTTP